MASVANIVTSLPLMVLRKVDMPFACNLSAESSLLYVFILIPSLSLRSNTLEHRQPQSVDSAPFS